MLSLPSVQWTPLHEDSWGSRGAASRIPNPCTRWRRLVSFTFRLSYPLGRSRFNHWLGGWVGLKAVWTLYRLEKSFVPAGNPTLIIAFPNRYNCRPVPKVNVYDRSVVIWHWQLSANTYMLQASLKATEYARFAKWSTVRACYHVTGYSTTEWMNDTDSHLDRVATPSGTAVRYQSKNYACLNALQFCMTPGCMYYTVLWTNLQRRL
jgi:hypothetical protein